jgi:hypothetical protein
MKKYLIGLMVLCLSQVSQAAFFCSNIDKTYQVITVENGNQTSVFVKDALYEYHMTGTFQKTTEGNYETFVYNLSPASAKLKIVRQEIIRGCHGRACLAPSNYYITKAKLNFLNIETDLDCQ